MDIKIKNIALTFLLTLALMLMFSQDLLHHHGHENYEHKHHDCPVCLFSISSANSAILNEVIIFSEPQFCCSDINTKSNTPISDNFTSQCFPDRAPPKS